MLSSTPFGSLIGIGVMSTSYIMLAGVYILYRFQQFHQIRTVETPVSVNYPFSRKCNYECGFCFHTEKTSSVLSTDDAKRGMKLLKEAGMKKLNFAGGEPFLYPILLHKLLLSGKRDLEIESISIVSNGSKITENFLRENGAFIDILAISYDSFNPKTNIKIGRGKKGENVQQRTKIAGWCSRFRIKFKINTVVCNLNWNEDMALEIKRLMPFRWKVFQCLIVTGENENEQRKRDARSFLVSDEQWKTFCDRHMHLECFVPENNEMMRGSYLILDENMCFLDKGEGEEKATESILEDGIYNWTNASEEGCGTSGVKAKELEW